MKKYLSALSLLVFISASAQHIQDSIAVKRATVMKQNMHILAVWGAANIGAGFISASRTNGSDHYFNLMNGYWGIANLAIAIAGNHGAKKQLDGPQNFERNLKEQHQLEKIVVFNGGLDIAYIMTGFYLKERGKRLGKDELTGYGNSLFLQGGFLMAFDIFQYLRYRQTGKLVEDQAKNWRFTTTANGVSVVHPF